MTIHSLELFLIKNKHEFTCSISQIANRKLGVDASYFLIELLKRLSPEELQAISVDGESEILYAYVNSFLEALKKNNVTPLFVFNGIPLTFEASSQSEALHKQKKLYQIQYSLSSFDPYDANIHTNLYRMDPNGSHRNNFENRRTFLYSSQRDSLDRLCDFLKNILDKKKIDYFVAPYLAMAQLSYFQRGASKRYVDAVYGPEDLLLFNVKRPIVSITIPFLQSESFRSSLSVPHLIKEEKQSSTIQWLDGESIYQDSRCTSWSQFVEACLLCGTAISPTLPQFEGTFLLKSAIELVMMLGSAYRVVEGFADTLPSGTAQELVQQYRRAFCYLNYCVIMNEKGLTIPPVPEDSVPNDISAYMGTRLPNELYYYISRGLLPSRMIGALVSGCFSDPVSILEQHVGDSSSQEVNEKPDLTSRKNAAALAAVNQRRFVDDLEEIWSQGLNLLTQPLHRFYQARDVISLHGHNQQASLKVMHSYDPPLYNDTRAWMIYDECIPLNIKEAVGENNRISIHSMLNCLRDEKFVEKSFCPDGGIGIKNPPKRLLSTTPEIVLSSFYRFLQIRSFISTTHQLTSWGSPLLMALEKCDVQYQSSMCVLFELLRLRQIKEPKFDSATSSTLSIPSVIEFLSKLATFLPTEKEKIYQLSAPDRDLLQFYLMQTSFGANLHELAAILIASVIMNANANRNLVNPYSIRKTFPFRRNFCSLLSGIIMNKLLQTLSGSDKDTNKAGAVENTFKQIKEEFPYVTDAKVFIARFLGFWAAFMEGVKEAENTSAIGKLVASKLYLTNDWLMSLGLV
ncbi:XP-G family nuclease [Schizosaccharomyces cryophilus OY26]|uniref:XP-G family nuclease n=1 Tax=Schizosaccharomyces cryophilus (strain OY26 / ATCC MYA-4695 / CBS 11777 / NBRC 106824 / NRRL Y48691) TaxID=653667 RepID=S9VX05_SCHCR|nr:XP-G family nuclease [Schizosaccharomyces cryophilus OY26]EPY50779.1 XP-G family nuclease [Schizosaccharomyces cryophilus OY26]